MIRLLSLLAACCLSACAMQNPSFVNQEKIQVGPEQVTFKRDAADLSRGDLLQLADDISRNGMGDVEVTILYPLQKGLENVAQAQKRIVQDTLRQGGVVHPIHFVVNPQGLGAPNSISISYQAMRAHAGCPGRITDADAGHYSHEADNPYTLGCERDHYFAAQIARPADLLGNDASVAAESQRMSKSLDTYRAGEQLTPAGTSSLSTSDAY